MPRLLLILLPLFFVSGACGLIYEVIWSQLFILVMGATTFAISTVLVAFMGGLAFGSYVGGRLCPRLRHPVIAYAILEIAIGAYALLLPVLLTWATPLYAALYPHVQSNFMLLALVRFAVSAMCLLVPTALMGATLPLLVEQLNRSGLGAGKSVAWLYGVNTAGAVVGTAAGGFALIPAFGLSSSTRVAAGLNLAVGAAALLARPLFDRRVLETVKAGRPKPAGEWEAWRTARPRCGLVAMVVFGLSGFAAMVYQVAWTRVLVPHLGPHTYSFTCVLTAFILGLALGSLAVGRWVDRWRNPIRVLGLLQGGIAVSALVAAIALDFFPSLIRRIAVAFGDDFTALTAAMLAAAMLVMIVPTLLMGATFPVVVRLVAPQGSRVGRETGRAYAFNTVGTILGAFVTGFVLIPWAAVSLRQCLLLGVAINAVCGLVAIAYSALGGVRRLSPWPVAVIASTLAVIPMTPKWDRGEFSETSYLSRSGNPRYPNVKFYREGIDATVLVTEDSGSRSLWINNKCDGSTTMTDARTQLLAGHLPALLADDPKHALVIGWGTGMTVGALTRHESIERIDAVEISRGVLEAAALFADYNYDAAGNPKVHIIRQDGRNHLLLTDRTYDLIVSEPSNPWIAGVAYLFTREFYELCKRRLSEDGVLLTWMHSYTVEPEDFRRIVHSVVDVMPEVTLWADGVDFMMIASKKPFDVKLSDWLRRYRAAGVRADLERLGYTTPGHLLGLYLAGPATLRRWTADAPLHFDDHPTVQYSGARTLLMDRDYYTQIALGCFALADDGLADVIRPNPAQPAHAALLEEAGRMQGSRRLQVESKKAVEADRLLESAELAWQAYRMFPDDPSARDNLHGAFQEMVFEGGWSKPGWVPLLEKIKVNLPPPPPTFVAPATVEGGLATDSLTTKPAMLVP